MSEYFIDLQPKSLEALNKKLVEILKMPDELLKQYTSKPHITEDEQATLEKAAVAYHAKKFDTALVWYRKCCISISKRSNVNINNNNEKSQLDIVIQYLLSKCLIESEQSTDLLDAQNILLQLEETVGQQYPMIYCALGAFYIKLFCFEDAERMINKGLGILNSGNENLITCYVPITNEVIVESTSQGLSRQLLKSKKQCMGWRRPDSMCFMTNCHSNAPYHLTGRNIYVNSPAFNGMVIIKCNNVNSCNISFHAACWKAQKKILSSGQKMSDKDFLNWECFTPNCGRDSVPSRIEKIEIHSNNGVLKVIEMPPEKQDRIRNTPSKGATRKQKIKHTEPKIKTKVPFDKKIIINQPKVQKTAPNEADELHQRQLKLNSLNENKFNVHGNSESRINYDEPLELNYSNDIERLTIVKSFIYSFFYQFISKNQPVKIDILQKKWEETTDSIGKCDILYNLNCANVTEFLLRSSQFSVIGDYIYTSALLPETNAPDNNDVYTTVPCAMDNNYDPKFESEDLEKNFNANPEELAATIINDPPCQAMNINEKNTTGPTPILDNSNPSTIHNSEELPLDSHHKIDKEFAYITEKIECENETVMNGDFKNTISLPTSPISIFEISTDIRDSVQEQLDKIRNELKAKDNQLIDMKMTMLRTNLDSQYMTITSFINSRFKDCQKEFIIVETIQNALLKYVGVPLPLQKREWIESIEVLSEIKKNLQQTYDEKLAEIHSKERCKEINDVHLTTPKIPTLPTINIAELLQVAFDMCHEHFQRSRIMSTPNIPNLYPPSPLANPPIFFSAYENYAPYLNYNPRQSSTPLIPHPSFMTNFPVITNNSQMHSSTKPMPKQPAIINKAQDHFRNSNGFLKNEIQKPKLDDEAADMSSVSNYINVSNIISEDAEPTASRKPSLDRLLDLLRSKNNGVLEYDLLWSVHRVRMNHNNSLTGLPLSTIADEVKQQLIHREKLQLADYSTHIHKEIQESYLNQRLLNASVFPRSAHVAASSNSRGLAIKKNPWKPITDPSSSHNVNFEQNVCAVCMDSLTGCTSEYTYTLQCKHVFHKKCIKDWFDKSRSCPMCRKHSVMDSEFPPL